MFKSKIFLIIAAFVLTLISCEKEEITPEIEQEGEFAFYIATLPAGQVIADSLLLENLMIEPEPLFTVDDIREYRWDDHRICLVDATAARVADRTDLYHKYFVITADGVRIYWGYFQAWIDSNACMHPVIILEAVFPAGTFRISSPFCIQRNYFDDQCLPSDDPEDPRNDPRIQAALADVIS